MPATLPWPKIAKTPAKIGSSASAMNMVAGTVGMARGEVLPTASTKNVDPEAKFELVLDRPRLIMDTMGGVSL